MNRQQRRQLEKNNTSQQQKRDLSTVMTKSENFDPNLQNLEHTATQNLHTPHMSMKDMPHMTTDTISAPTQATPTSRLEAMNPAGDPPLATQPLPLPTPTFDVSSSEPKKNVAKGKEAVPTQKQPARLAKITAGLTQLYAAIGLFVTRADAYDGILLIKESERRAVEVVEVAKHHPKVLAFLENAIESNDYITLAIGHGLMAYAILAHHGRIKADPMFLAQLGYHEQQVLAPPPGAEGQNGSTSGATAQYASIS